MPNRKNLITILCAMAIFAASTSQCLAQEGIDTTGWRHHELSVGMGGGFHCLNPDMSGGTVVVGTHGGVTFNVRYDYLFSQHWSVGTGVELTTYTSDTETNEYRITKDAIDIDGEKYEHRMTLSAVKETQSALVVDIPVGMGFRTDVSENWIFKMGVSAHLSLIAKDRFETQGGTITTRGYYENYGGLLIDGDIPEAGFYVIEPEFSGRIRLWSPTFGIGAQIGMERKLTDRLNLEMTIYGKCAVTDAKGKTRYAQQYDPDCRRADGYMAEYHSSVATTSCSSVKPMSVGFMVRLGVNMGKKRASRRLRNRTTEEVLPTADNSTNELEEIRSVKAEPTKLSQAELAALDIKRRDSIATGLERDIQDMIDEAGGIHFDLGSGGLDQESTATVKRIAELLNAHPDYNIDVTGHTCDMGTSEVNERIGRERAETVARCLENNGVYDGRIHVISMGATEPIAPNDTEEHRSMNRRVKITIRR